MLNHVITIGSEPLVLAVLKGLAVILVIFPIAAACSMAERKVSAWIQRRPGPNRTIPPFLVGIPGIGVLQRLGLFQLAADGAKFLFKEEPLPNHVNRLYYTLAPVIAIVCVFQFFSMVGYQSMTEPSRPYERRGTSCSKGCFATSASLISTPRPGRSLGNTRRPFFSTRKPQFTTSSRHGTSWWTASQIR